MTDSQIRYISEVYNEDCMIGMSRYPDKHFDLAIVDPPYFSGPEKRKYYGREFSNHGVRRIDYKPLENSWAVPDAVYFRELERVSKHQIVWGCNYYEYWAGMMQGCGDGTSKKMQGNKALNEKKIHPTQKPVMLYKWLLDKFALDGWSILDTHLGSGSSRIASQEMGFDFTGFEINEHYFEAQEKRFKQHISQLKMFAP